MTILAVILIIVFWKEIVGLFISVCGLAAALVGGIFAGIANIFK